MKTLIYSAKDFEIPFLKEANNGHHEFTYTSERLTTHTAMKALGYNAISIFSADDASNNVLEKLKDFRVKYISLRSAGYDNVNLMKAQKIGIRVANAPDYSPHAIAEHAVGLLQAINRKIVLADRQLKNYDFTLSNQVGMDLLGKTVGIVGLGKIGKVIAKIMHGFGCRIVATDIEEDAYIKSAYDVGYKDIFELCEQSDVIMLSLPLNEATSHLIDKEKIALMKSGVLIVNVARGGVVCTRSILESIDNHKLGGYATDVYEYESGIFFYDRSKNKPQDPLLKQLMGHPKVVLTPHQAFVTREALQNIAKTTIENLRTWEKGQIPKTELTSDQKALEFLL